MARTFLVCLICVLICWSNDQSRCAEIIHAKTGSALRTDKPIRCMFEDKLGNVWFGTDGDGVFRYDGAVFSRFSEREGLANGFVISIQEDQAGKLWFGLRGAASRYDGKSFTNIAYKEALHSDLATTFRSKPGDLWFGAPDGAYRHDGQSLVAIPLSQTDGDHKFQPANSPTPYSVYSIFKDKLGNVWFGTEQRGVCCYDGTSFSWLTEKGLNKAAVRSIFQDRTGTLWFGNNGGGVYRYDGTTLSNFTEEHGLGNPDFLTTLKGKPGTLARIWTIGEDQAGNIWFGTIDAGAWRFDGKSLTNFTARDGLGCDGIWTIARNRAGGLWFGTDEGVVLEYNGKSFSRLAGPQ